MCVNVSLVFFAISKTKTCCSTEMSAQCSYFKNYSDLLSLLQRQRVTNVTIAVQVHIKKIKINFIFYFFGAEIPRQIIVKSASDAEIPLPRKNRGCTDARAVCKPQ